MAFSNEFCRTIDKLVHREAQARGGSHVKYGDRDAHQKEVEHYLRRAVDRLAGIERQKYDVKGVETILTAFADGYFSGRTGREVVRRPRNEPAVTGSINYTEVVAWIQECTNHLFETVGRCLPEMSGHHRNRDSSLNLEGNAADEALTSPRPVPELPYKPVNMGNMPGTRLIGAPDGLARRNPASSLRFDRAL